MPPRGASRHTRAASAAPEPAVLVRVGGSRDRPRVGVSKALFMNTGCGPHGDGSEVGCTSHAAVRPHAPWPCRDSAGRHSIPCSHGPQRAARIHLRRAAVDACSINTAAAGASVFGAATSPARRCELRCSVPPRSRACALMHRPPMMYTWVHAVRP
eukprot:127952-Prymnesium_polylepis.2